MNARQMLPILALVAASMGCVGSLDTQRLAPDARDTVEPEPEPSTPDLPTDPVDPFEPSDDEERPYGARSDLRRLTPSQYRHAVEDLFGGLVEPGLYDDANPDLSTSGYSTNHRALPTTPRAAEQLFRAAMDAGASSAEHLDVLLPCTTQAPETACALDFVERYAARAFRRPLDEDERASFTDAWDLAIADGFSGVDAGALLVTLLLQMPQFVYVHEIGEGAPDEHGRTRLTDFEVATRIALTYGDTIPDAPLLDAARAGALDDPEVRAEHAARLLTRDRRVLSRFVREWLHLGAHLEKDQARFPDFDDATAVAVREELERSIALAIERDDSLEDVLTMRSVPLSTPLARLYGVPAPASEWELVELPTRHQGLLTRPYFLASHSGASESSPVERGYTIMKQLLCAPPGAPPDDAESLAPDYPPMATARQKSEILRDSNPFCAGCHDQIDPIGLALEHYDATGAWRELTPALEGSVPIDASGHISETEGLADTDIAGRSFDGLGGLNDLLAQSKTVEQCVARHWFRFSLHEIESTRADALLVRELHSEFSSRGSSLRALMLALARSDAFLYQHQETP